MTLTLYHHPFSSFCQKALIALYENGTAFTSKVIDLSDANSRAELQRLWPFAKFPVLRDDSRGVTVPESSLIVDYLDQHYPGPTTFVPADADAALRVHMLDRIIDSHLLLTVGKIVTDHFRSENRHDPDGVEQAKSAILTAYAFLETELPKSGWAVGEGFTLADCAAAPALFYSNIVVPFGAHRNLAAYYQRLLTRPSFQRAIEGARPYRALFPLSWPEGYD